MLNFVLQNNQDAFAMTDRQKVEGAMVGGWKGGWTGLVAITVFIAVLLSLVCCLMGRHWTLITDDLLVLPS